MDTINEAFSTIDEQDSEQTNRQFACIRKLTDETRISIVLMHHMGQGEQSRMSCSAGGASARAALTLTRNMATGTGIVSQLAAI